MSFCSNASEPPICWRPGSVNERTVKTGPATGASSVLTKSVTLPVTRSSSGRLTAIKDESGIVSEPLMI